MHAISHKQARLTGLAIALAAGFFFLPVTSGHLDRIGYATAWAGDQGGAHDRVGGNEGYHQLHRDTAHTGTGHALPNLPDRREQRLYADAPAGLFELFGTDLRADDTGRLQFL